MASKFSRAAAMRCGLVVMATVWVPLHTLPARAQDAGDLKAKVAEIKEAQAQNKQALAQYTWQEQDTISLKGEVKKQESYQVRMGPDGKPQKTPLNPEPPAQQPSGGRMKQKIVEKKKEEYKEYAQQIAALAHQYAQPDPERLQAAVQQGNVSLSPGGGGEIHLVIKNYVKPNDSVTLTFNRAEKAIQGMEIASYLDSPSDAVKISAQYAKLPDRTNHVSTMNLDGVSKQLNVAIQNSNYNKL